MKSIRLHYTTWYIDGNFVQLLSKFNTYLIIIILGPWRRLAVAKNNIEWG